MTVRKVSRKEQFRNFYEVLGLPDTATAAEIRAAYKRKALSTHPDKGGTSGEFRLLVQAFEVLFSCHSRAVYDEKLKHFAKCPLEKTSKTIGKRCREPKGKDRPKSTKDERSSAPRVKRSKRELLEQCMGRLKKILQDCPNDVRLQQITSMSELLRGKLLIFMEVSKHATDEAKDALRVAPSIGSEAGRKSSNQVYLPIAYHARQKPQRESNDRRRGLAKGIYSIAAKSKVYYEARIVYRNLCFASRTSRNLEDTVHRHTMLAALRQRIAEMEEEEVRRLGPAEPCVEWVSRLKRLLQRAIKTEGVVEMGVSFQVVIDARLWVGKMVYSPRMRSCERALDVWERAECVRLMEGWPGIKVVWMEWMQAERRSCFATRTRSQEEAEGVVSTAESAYSATRRKREALREAREAAQRRRMLELKEKQERRVEKMNRREEMLKMRIEGLLRNKLLRCVRRAESLARAMAEGK